MLEVLKNCMNYLKEIIFESFFKKYNRLKKKTKLFHNI